MRLPANALAWFALSCSLALPQAAPAPLTYSVAGESAGPWPHILGSAGFRKGTPESAGICVVRSGEAADAAKWLQRAESGAFVVLEGDSPLAQTLGFRPTAKHARVVSVQDLRSPGLSIVWEHAGELPVFEIPPVARVFTRERWSGAPLAAGFRHGSGGILWLAVSPGDRGYERFPYLLQDLADLGVSPPLRSRRLWAFFDASYRSRVDLDYFAERWRRTGIAALHVAAWHYFEPDESKDAYLRRLIEACHREGILVYAWLELPHVSERFWKTHPEWREKTALLQDAHLDWRKLMNLANRDCARTVAAGVRHLMERFDWDGVNLAELYFESLQGHENPSRFTPMNEDIRREFKQRRGFDPLDLFDQSSARHYSKNPAGLRAFLDYRVELSRRLRGEWMRELESLRESKPHLGLVLTQVDDRLDPRMRDAVGASTAGLPPLLQGSEFTLLIEDPATVWNLGPERYRTIAGKYADLAAQPAIDINIVERYQDVYPAKRQTGTELLQLVSQASRVFPRVALYFENSILAPDVPWLSSAAAVADRLESSNGGLAVESRHGLGIPWKGAAKVDGRLWPVMDGEALWLPPGAHAVEAASAVPSVRLLDLNAELTAASSLPAGLEFAYSSASRAIAILDRRPLRLEIDEEEVKPKVLDGGSHYSLFLPRGQHLVSVTVELPQGGGKRGRPVEGHDIARFEP